MRTLRIPNTLPVLGFALALLLLCSVAWLNVRNAAQVQDALYWVGHSERVRMALAGLLSSSQDVIIGERGFALTGTMDFLEPYNDALQTEAAKLLALRELTADNPLQKLKSNALETHIASLLTHSALVVQLRKGSGFLAAQDQVRLGKGKAAMDAVRACIAEMDSLEEQLLVQRTTTLSRETELARDMTRVGSLVSFVLFLGVFVLVIRESRLRQKASRALRTSEESLSITLQSIGDAVIATDAAGKLTWLNPVAEALTGWVRSDAIGRPVGEVFRIINETTRQTLVLPSLDTLASGTVHALTNHTLLLARDGTERAIADNCSPIRNREGQVTGAVIVFRSQEAELSRAFRAIEAMDNAVFMFSPDTLRFFFVNGGALQQLGYTRTELLAMTLMELIPSLTEPAFRAKVQPLLSGSLTSLQFTAMHRHKDGRQIPVEIVLQTVGKDAQRCFVLLCRDVSERQRNEERLHKAHEELGRVNAELAQSSKLKDEFMANMSHELRTPLNAILGLSEALLEQVSGPLTLRQTKSLNTISTSGTHLLSLINDILELSKIEAGKLELHTESLNVHEFCMSCLVFVRTQALEKHISVAFELDGSVAWFTGDAKRCRQILVNLLSNAVKFTPEGGRMGLAVSAPAGEDLVRFTVWDTGIGIAAEDQRKLFHSFSQIDSGLSRSQEGTGLGLALVARLAELHGGSVALESEVGKGSRFTVSLPQSSGPMLEPRLTHAVEPNRQVYRHALIIEDDATASEQLVRYLNELGLTCVQHLRGNSSLDAVLRERPDVILLDIMLPGESGWLVLARLKEDPRTRDTPVIIVSVVDEPMKSKALGAVAHFTKPVTREQLAAFFNRHLTRSPFPSPPNVLTPRGSGPLILLAEDNEPNIETIGGYLEDKGFTLRYARNGLIAVELAKSLHPALILMDIQMPVMDGLAATREIRLDPALKTMPIVVLTALAMPGDRERCMEAGATDYLSKPVKLATLAALIEQLVADAAKLKLP